MVEVLIDRLIHHNIGLELVGQNDLKVHTRLLHIPEELLIEIKSRKSELIQYLKDHEGNHYDTIPRGADQSGYVLSSAQRRLWILSQLQQSNVAYNMPGVFVFEGALNEKVLEESFRKLISRHQILRTVFREDDQGQVQQVVRSEEEVNFTIQHEDISGQSEYGNEVLINEWVKQQVNHAFDLSAGPLLR